MYEHSASGPSLSEARALDKSADLDHISVHAAAGATADNPKWLVCHYSSKDDSSPIAEHEYTDGHQLLADIADAAGIEPDEDDKGSGY